MNELKTKTEKTTDGALKKNPWRRLPKGGKIAVIVVGILAVLAVLAAFTSTASSTCCAMMTAASARWVRSARTRTRIWTEPA